MVVSAHTVAYVLVQQASTVPLIFCERVSCHTRPGAVNADWLETSFEITSAVRNHTEQFAQGQGAKTLKRAIYLGVNRGLNRLSNLYRIV